MRTLMMLIVAGTAGHHTPADPQQVPPKVFQVTNLTNAKLDFHVLVSPGDALTPQNEAVLASRKSKTLGCGRAHCFVVMTPPVKGVGRWGVAQGSKYKFSVIGGALSLNLTS